MSTPSANPKNRPDLQSLVRLPRGTRVTLTRVEGAFRPPDAGVVVATFDDGADVRFDDGRQARLPRAALVTQRDVPLQAWAERQWAYASMQDRILLKTVVGSHAFGLASASSDVDVKGVFLAPFDRWAGLAETPHEIHDETSDTSLWEVEACIRQALRADPNTLEMLHSPLVQTVTDDGQALLDLRDAFASKRVVGTFGRYAQRQLQKLHGAQRRRRALLELLDAIAGKSLSRDGAIALLSSVSGDDDGAAVLQDLLQSTADRGVTPTRAWDDFVVVARDNPTLLLPKARPKHGMNLVRLLHSCAHFLDEGVPMLQVPEPLRTLLLSMKAGDASDDDVHLAVAEANARIEERLPHTKLPDEPDVERANALLVALRQRSAFSSSMSATSSAKAAAVPTEPPAIDVETVSTLLPSPLPFDVVPERLRRFLSRYVDGPQALPVLWVGLTGAHAYGFASPDSDLDLKGVHAFGARHMFTADGAESPHEVIEDFEGREMDFSSHELSLVVRLLEDGNGNMLERLLGPLPVWTTPAGHELKRLAQAGLHRGSHKHYRGFLRGMEREFNRTLEAGAPSAKRALYAFRVALTGVHLLRAGEVVTDVRVLAPELSTSFVDELIDVKSAAEKATLDERQAQEVLRWLPLLGERVDAAREASSLPLSLPNRDELRDFLVHLRMSQDAQGVGPGGRPR